MPFKDSGLTLWYGCCPWGERRAVTYYRLYHLVKGHIRTFDEIEADDDESAKAVANTLVVGERSELWQRGRLVASLPERDESD